MFFSLVKKAKLTLPPAEAWRKLETLQAVQRSDLTTEIIRLRPKDFYIIRFPARLDRVGVFIQPGAVANGTHDWSHTEISHDLDPTKMWLVDFAL